MSNYIYGLILKQLLVCWLHMKSDFWFGFSMLSLKLIFGLLMNKTSSETEEFLSGREKKYIQCSGSYFTGLELNFMGGYFILGSGIYLITMCNTVKNPVLLAILWIVRMPLIFNKGIKHENSS